MFLTVAQYVAPAANELITHGIALAGAFTIAVFVAKGFWSAFDHVVDHFRK